MSDKLGDVVFAVVDPRQNNGSDVAPAVITRVWGHDMVNVKVTTDGPDNLWLTSVRISDDRPEQDDESVPKDASGVQRVVFRNLD